MNPKLSITAAVLVLAAAAAPASAQEPSPSGSLTITAAVKQALATSHSVKSSAAEVEHARALKNQARGGFGPVLKGEVGVQFWESSLVIDFAVPGGSGSTIPFPVRDATTWNASVTLAQPLTPLWSIYENHTIQTLGIDVARLKREAEERDVAYQTVEGFARVLQAQAVATVAQDSVTQRAGQVERAQALEKAEVVHHDDVLRAQLGLAEAKQQLSVARRNVTLARARLRMILGLKRDQTLPPLVTPPANQGGLVGLAAAQDQALRSRAEVAELHKRVAQAEHGVDAAISQMLPQVSAVVAFQGSGGSEFQQDNAFFVGLNVAWTIFDWGSTYYGIDAARASRDQAREGLAQLREGIELEVRAAHTSAQSAQEVVELATQARAQAEEHYKLVQARYERGVATSFDVLDAQTQLANARANAESAAWELYIARAALRRAQGLSPLPEGDRK